MIDDHTQVGDMIYLNCFGITAFASLNEVSALYLNPACSLGELSVCVGPQVAAQLSREQAKVCILTTSGKTVVIVNVPQHLARAAWESTGPDPQLMQLAQCSDSRKLSCSRIYSFEEPAGPVTAFRAAQKLARCIYKATNP